VRKWSERSQRIKEATSLFTLLRPRQLIEDQSKMAESNPTPQLAHRTGNAVEREVSEVSNRGLDLYKDEIIALYSRKGIRMQDLPQLVEEELGIKAKCAPTCQLQRVEI
jgi:hypothetical protein